MTASFIPALAAALLLQPAIAQTVAGSIRGRVIDEKTEAPVRFATVMLTGPFAEAMLTPPRRVPVPAPIQISADEQGRFVFENVRPGNYAVGARRDGYMPSRAGAAGAALALLPVKEGEQVGGVVIKMPPCGVIAGKVLNEAGEPVRNVELVALRYYYGAWLWRLAATPETPLKTYTNDLGEFRMGNIGAGQYILRAAAPPQAARNRTPGVGYPSIFFPNALGPEGAQPITVESGAVTPISLTLQKGAAFRITGHIDAQGSDRDICFGLTPKRYNAALTQVIGRVSRFSKADGNFVIDDVPPGSYSLSAAFCRGRGPLGAILPLEVAGDIEGLQVRLGAGQKLSGVLKGEGVNVSGVLLRLLSPELIPGFIPMATAAADGAFTFEPVLPRHHVVSVPGLPAGAYVKSVKYGGKEAPTSGFEIDGDATLEITLSAQGAAQLRGSVVDKAGRPVPYAGVMALPADGGPAESARDVVADEKGNFVFPAMRPGAYRTLAWEVRYDPLGVESADPLLPMLFDANARSVTLGPGQPVNVALTINTQEDVNRARAAASNTPPKKP